MHCCGVTDLRCKGQMDILAFGRVVDEADHSDDFDHGTPPRFAELTLEEGPIRLGRVLVVSSCSCIESVVAESACCSSFNHEQHVPNSRSARYCRNRCAPRHVPKPRQYCRLDWRCGVGRPAQKRPASLRRLPNFSAIFAAAHNAPRPRSLRVAETPIRDCAPRRSRYKVEAASRANRPLASTSFDDPDIRSRRTPRPRSLPALSTPRREHGRDKVILEDADGTSLTYSGSRWRASCSAASSQRQTRARRDRRPAAAERRRPRSSRCSASTPTAASPPSSISPPARRTLASALRTGAHPHRAHLAPLRRGRPSSGARRGARPIPNGRPGRRCASSRSRTCAPASASSTSSPAPCAPRIAGSSSRRRRRRAPTMPGRHPVHLGHRGRAQGRRAHQRQPARQRLPDARPHARHPRPRADRAQPAADVPFLRPDGGNARARCSPA